MTTNWDELEGWPLNVALCRLMGWTDFKKGQGYWVGTKDGQQRVLPDYANSIDAQIRDLVPRLAKLPWPNGWGIGSDMWGDGSLFGASIGVSEWTPAVTPSLALGRAIGKALEAAK